MSKKKSFSEAFDLNNTEYYSDMHKNILSKSREYFYNQKIKSIELDNLKKKEKIKDSFKENHFINKSFNEQLNPTFNERKRFYGESKNLDLLVDIILNGDKEEYLKNTMNIHNFETQFDFNNKIIIDVETIIEDLAIQNDIIKKIGYTMKLYNEKNYLICNFKNCNAYFKSKYYVNKHIKTHIDVFPFRCPICSVKFIRKDNAQAHLKICVRKRILINK